MPNLNFIKSSEMQFFLFLCCHLLEVDTNKGKELLIVVMLCGGTQALHFSPTLNLQQSQASIYVVRNKCNLLI